MKVPPKRKGNSFSSFWWFAQPQTLNESPSEKEGKFYVFRGGSVEVEALNESPSEKEGKFCKLAHAENCRAPSMKVPPKRKGNCAPEAGSAREHITLNESPSEKEGKFSPL